MKFLKQLVPFHGPKTMRDLREVSARELDELFRQATADAAKNALKNGVAVTGLDERGRVVVTDHPIEPETPSDQHNETDTLRIP